MRIVYLLLFFCTASCAYGMKPFISEKAIKNCPEIFKGQTTVLLEGKKFFVKQLPHPDAVDYYLLRHPIQRVQLTEILTATELQEHIVIDLVQEHAGTKATWPRVIKHYQRRKQPCPACTTCPDRSNTIETVTTQNIQLHAQTKRQAATIAQLEQRNKQLMALIENLLQNVDEIVIELEQPEK